MKSIGPTGATRANSRGFRPVRCDPYEHHFGSRASQQGTDRLHRAITIIRSRDGIGKTDLLRLLDMSPNYHEFVATVCNFDRNVYEGCHEEDPGEHDGWLYYDSESC